MCKDIFQTDHHPTSNTFIAAITAPGTPTTVITSASSSVLPRCGGALGNGEVADGFGSAILYLPSEFLLASGTD